MVGEGERGGPKTTRLVGELTGAGTALAATSFLGPAAALLAPPIAAGVEEVLNRALTRRQQARIRTVTQYAADRYSELLSQGETLRSDDFFEARDGRWSANEVTEAVLLAAASQPQELKLEYIGNLLANCAVNHRISVPTAHWLLSLAEDLTWTQYVQLALVVSAQLSETFTLPDIKIGASVVGKTWAVAVSMSQLENLGFGQRELIVGVVEGDVLEDFEQGFRLINQRATPQAMLLWSGLGLNKIPAEILAEEYVLLSQFLPDEDLQSDNA